MHNNSYQILLVTACEGWYQEEGKPPVKFRAGDMALADGVTYWHGAATDSWLSHIGVNAGEVEWLEPVTDEEYAAVSK